jgi:hypothetical protein
MDTKGLLFIPDISGFTRFVNETEIDHSRLIIQELLEILINANEIGLEISEIEGDAILFYKFGAAPDLKSLYKQVERMFRNFHAHLMAYDQRKFCHCKACVSAVGLTLKVITHYGEFTGYSVKNFSKLIGKDIIVAHQLLKNDIALHEYWLVTRSLVPGVLPADLPGWMHWESSVKKTENGEIGFRYAQLSELKNHIPTQYPLDLELKEKTKVLSLSREYDTDIITLFHAAGDFNYRSHWLEGVKSVEEVNHYLPRVGMRCRCMYENGEEVLYASGYVYDPNRIEFSETDEKKYNSTWYTLEKTGEKSTRLTIDYYIRKNLGSALLFKLRNKKKMESTMLKSMNNLAELVSKEFEPAHHRQTSNLKPTI